MGSVLSRSELDPFLYIWYHICTVRTQNGLSPSGRNYRKEKAYQEGAQTGVRELRVVEVDGPGSHEISHLNTMSHIIGTLTLIAWKFRGR